MKKIILTVALLSTQLFGEVSAYIGLGINAGPGIQGSVAADGTELETTYTGASASIKFGTIDKNNNRSEFVFTSIVASADSGSFAQNTSGDTNSSEYVGIDYNAIWTLGKNKSFAPFFGLGLGLYSNNSIDGVNATSGEVESATGFSLNASLGLMVAFGELLEMEFAVNSKAISWNLDDPKLTETLSTAYVGVNFRF